MIFEKIPLQFDIEKLHAHVRDHVLHLKPQMVGSFFGGWSVLSSTGSYLDGWASGERAYQSTFMPGATMDEKIKALGILPINEYVVPTEICFGYLAEAMRAIRDAGLRPARARLSLLKARGRSSLHRDGADDQYAVRLHIPILSNESCLFTCEEGSAHLEPTGDAYLLRVNRMHQVTNDSDSDRIHLIMSVEDTKGISKYHRRPHGPEAHA